jgi:NADPH-dependent F420 reductase
MLAAVKRPLAVVGGTGPEGIGLALRFAVAGEPIVIGSRVLARALDAAAAVRAAVPGADVHGAENADAVASAGTVVLSVPFSGLAEILAAGRLVLDGKIVIDVVVPVAFRDGFCELLPVPGGGSAGEMIQRALPAARVVSAFKNLPAERLRDLAVPLEGDVVLCGNDAAARAEVAALIARLPRLRAVDAGALANARYLEALTALLLNLNRRHRAKTSIAILF